MSNSQQLSPRDRQELRDNDPSDRYQHTQRIIDHAFRRDLFDRPARRYEAPSRGRDRRSGHDRWDRDDPRSRPYYEDEINIRGRGINDRRAFRDNSPLGYEPVPRDDYHHEHRDRQTRRSITPTNTQTAPASTKRRANPPATTLERASKNPKTSVPQLLHSDIVGKNIPVAIAQPDFTTLPSAYTEKNLLAFEESVSIKPDPDGVLLKPTPSEGTWKKEYFVTRDEAEVIAIEKKVTAFESHRLNFPIVLEHLVQQHNPKFDPKRLNQMNRDLEDEGAEASRKWHEAIAAQKALSRKETKFGREVLSQ